MASRKEHLDEADDLLERAKSAEIHGAPSRAADLRRVAETHIRMAEALKPARPTYGTTRISRERR